MKRKQITYPLASRNVQIVSRAVDTPQNTSHNYLLKMPRELVGTMTQLAYIRVSSVGQSLEVQRDKVTASGVEPKNVFEEKRSGLDTGRPELKACLRSLRKGDTLVITKIDRLAR